MQMRELWKGGGEEEYLKGLENRVPGTQKARNTHRGGMASVVRNN